MKTAKKQVAAWVKGQIAPSQIKAIHTAIHKLGIDDDTYRAMLQERFRAQSCKELSWRQAEELLEHLNGGTRDQGSGTRKTRSSRFPVPGSRSLKHQDMDGRPGFANGAQLRLIDALWSQVSRAEDDDGREKALDAFCRRILNVAGLRMVKGWQVEKLVKALEAMGAVKKETP